MKQLVLASVLVLALFAYSSAHAQEYKMGLGARLSSNPAAVSNSITFKYFTNQTTAIETLLSFGDPLAVGVLLEKHKPIGAANTKLFYGGGGYVGFGGRRNTGLQGVLGIDYKFSKAPFNVCLDWKPELNVWKEFSFEPAALGISARYTFN